MGGHNKLDLTGHRYNKLFVSEYSHSDSRKERWYKCICDCGNETVVKGSRLRNGNTKSCGCQRVIEGRKVGLRSVVHGLINTPTYATWKSMKRRCLNENDENYRWYGAKGVTICQEWMTFEGFLKDMGERPVDKTLDRINPFGNYEPSNCRWADDATQKSNTRKQYLESVCQS